MEPLAGVRFPFGTSFLRHRV